MVDDLAAFDVCLGPTRANQQLLATGRIPLDAYSAQDQLQAEREIVGPIEHRDHQPLRVLTAAAAPPQRQAG